jgi:L-fuconolactonase
MQDRPLEYHGLYNRAQHEAKMHRRTLLKLAAATTANTLLPTLARSAVTPVKIPGRILDAHIHLFDPTRPGGVPFPLPNDLIYKPALPDRYIQLAQPHNIRGAIAIEASPLATDNDWLLKTAASNPIIVGVIGNLDPGSPAYLANLDRLHQNPLFLGFRYGNLWDRDLATDLTKPGFLDGLKALAQASLVFESANPNPDLILALRKISEAIPTLRIVIDHLPHAPIPKDPAELKSYNANLAALAANPNVYVKLSEIPQVTDGKLITEPCFYKPALDQIWQTFGEDHILFGSDWPNSDHVASFDATLKIVRQYIAAKSESAAHKYYWQNSINAYHWKPRTKTQS